MTFYKISLVKIISKTSWKIKLLALGVALIGKVSDAEAAGCVSRDSSSVYIDSLSSVDWSGISYISADSLAVVQLLRENSGGNDVLYYARRLLGRPYVAHTLEIADPEKLVVNLRQLDCTTLVETVCALSLTKRQSSDNFADYCRNLEKLRYWGGKRSGYCSRLHYFTWWMHDNMNRNLIEEVSDTVHFVQPMRVHNYYMSRHPEKYKFLRGKRDRVEKIKELEQIYNGKDGTYLSKSKTGLSQKDLNVIEDGDIVAIVTNKAGLDYSHLGFAVWEKDGRLHLLNASMVKGRVIEDKQTLEAYLDRYAHTQGIRVFRLKSPVKL